MDAQNYTYKNFDFIEFLKIHEILLLNRGAIIGCNRR